MKLVTLCTLGVAAAVSFSSVYAVTDEDGYEKRKALSKKIKKMAAMKSKMPLTPPAGIGGVNFLPKKGAFVTGIKLKNVSVSGLVQGDSSISRADATHPTQGVLNQFFGQPSQPKTLRVVPVSAKASIMSPFINYTLTDTTSLVATLPIINKEVTLETFNPAGTASVGTNKVSSKGLGDLKIGAIHRLYRSPKNKHNVLVNAILSVPTGSITEEDTVLQPTGATAVKRLAYGMQLGTGTYDAVLGLVYWGKEKKLGWGAKLVSITPLESENDEGWKYGDKTITTAWASYAVSPAVVTSFRLNHESQGTISGMDSTIVGPSLGAQTGNYGGTLTEASLGLNWAYSKGHNLGFEYTTPIAQDRNGLQGDRESIVSVSWNNAFF